MARVMGNNQDNELIGTNAADVIDGRGGDDNLFGRAGADELLGGPGIDELFGEAGNDVLRAGAGSSDLFDPPQRLFGGDGDDVLLGGGVDLPLGETDAPIRGDVPADSTGSSEFLDGGSGNDRLVAGDGDDALVGGSGRDHLDGGSEALAGEFSVGDTVLYRDEPGPITVDLAAGTAGTPSGTDRLIDIEGVVATSAGDRLSGSAAGDAFFAGRGDDRVFGRGGFDNLSGEEGNDLLHGGADRDLVDGREGEDRLFGDDGPDVLTGDVGHDTLFGGEDDDDLFGFDGQDALRGGAGNDALFGGRGDDELVGGQGGDMLFGDTDPASDLVDLPRGADRFVFARGSGRDTILDFEDARDVIDLSGFAGIDRFAEVRAEARQVGEDVVIDLGAAAGSRAGVDVLTLENVDRADLSAGDFDFG